MQTVNTQQTPSMNDVLKAALKQMAAALDKTDEPKMDEGMAGYLAGYLDRVRQEQKS